MRGKIQDILILLFLSPALCQATIVAFYTDGVIQDGDVYDYVSVYNDATVDMTGGIVTVQLGAYDSSTVNISGGVLHGVFTSAGASTASTLNLSGSMQADAVGIWGLGTLNMLGGTVGSVENNNIANLYGGIISDYLWATSTVNIYGYGFQYNPLAGDYRGGQLTGFWMNDTPFSIDLWYLNVPYAPLIDTYSHIVLIPEPATILLLGLGVLMLKKRN
jgi:hypothetical protein